MLRRFGDKLRYLRRQRQITQVDLAYQLGTVAQGHLSSLERGHRQPSIELVSRVADLFTVSMDYLLRDVIPVDQPIAAPVLPPAPEGLPRLFGAKLRYLRTQRYLTQVDVSNLLSLRTQAHISLLESGRSEPSLELLLQLSDLFGVTTEYLLRDALPIEPPIISGSNQLTLQS